MKVFIGIPWRHTVDREPAYRMVWNWWEDFISTHLSGHETLMQSVDTDHEQFNLGRCRNQLVTQAEQGGFDVVVLTDADFIGQPEVMDRAISSAGDGKLHYPFDKFIYAGYDSPIGHNWGGCIVTTPADWWEMGGQDERFAGWGGDDDQLAVCAKTLTGVVQHEGVGVGLWHRSVRDVGSERHRPNSILAQCYWKANGNREAILKLIAERPK